MPELHARLGPSNHRWPACPGSVREEACYEDVAGAAAIDGTGSHLLLEMCLINGVRADAYIGQIIGANDIENPLGWLVEEDRCERVQQCLDYVVRRNNELKVEYPGATIEVIAEGTSNPGMLYGRTDWWGTCDITISVILNGECVFIEVCDYKDGRGWVNVKDNTQLVSYMMGRLAPYIQSKLPRDQFDVHRCSVDKCRLSIVQPKTNPSVRYEDYQTATIMGLADSMAAAAALTDEPDAPLVPGKHCQWCKANPKRGGHCTAETTQSLQVVKSMSNDVIATDGQSLFEMVGQSLDKIDELTSEQLSQLADIRPSYNTIFDRVEKEIEKRINEGSKVPGYGFKPGRSSQAWNGNEEEIVKALKAKRLKKDDIYPPKLISPAAVLKLDNLTDKQKEDIKAKLITQKAGKMTLSKVARGEEMSIEEMFKDISEKDVAQSNTDVVQSPSTSVVNEPIEEISFF